MDVLFIGKYDSAGSCIAECLIREGHKISWITDEQCNLWDKSLKGNVYRKKLTREEFLQVLKAENIDTVIFMTGQLREDYELRDHYESHLTNLTNALGVFRSHLIKTFVYLSSIETEFNQVLTPSLNELSAGEEICKAYQNMYNIPVLILKFGCIYGHRMAKDEGYIGSLHMQIKAGKKLFSKYSKEDLIDVMYGNDLGMAAKMLLDMKKMGTYRIMTGRPLTMQALMDCIAEIAGCEYSAEWTQERHTQSLEYFTSDSRIKSETGWMPLYLLQEKGKEKVKQNLYDEIKQEEAAESIKNTFYHRLNGWRYKNKVLATVETVVLFLFTCFLLQFQNDVNDLKYVDIRLLYVVSIAAVFGVKMGILADILVIGSYVHSLINANVDPSYLLYSVDTWIPLMVYTMASIIIGYLTDRRLDDLESSDEQFRLLNDKYEFLKKIHGTTLEIKNYLQRQIASSKQSFGHIYDVTIELDVLKPDVILLKVINILENIMGCEHAAVFLLDGEGHQFARLKACSSALKENIGHSLEMVLYKDVLTAFEKDQIFVNTSLLPDYPDYAAPVYYQEKLYGFVALYQIPTEKFTVYYQNAFHIVTNLIERYLIKALEYESANHEQLYLPGTDILRPEALEERINILSSSKEYASYAYVCGKVYMSEAMEQKEAESRLCTLIRGSDCLGIDRDGHYIVILMNMTANNLNIVRDRFEKNGFLLEVEV